MSTTKSSIIPSASQELLSFVVTFFASFVLLAGIDNFVVILRGLDFNKAAIKIVYNWNRGDYFIIIAVVAFIINLLRIIHGLIIALYDERNPTQYGKSPLDLKTLVTFIIIILTPYISIEILKNFNEIQWNQFSFGLDKEKTEMIFLIFVFFLPNIVYIIWDKILGMDLARKKKDDENKEKYADYEHFVENWLKMDKAILGIIIVILFLVFINDILPASVNNYFLNKQKGTIPFKFILLKGTFLAIYSFIQIIIIILDYSLNKEYYFPKS